MIKLVLVLCVVLIGIAIASLMGQMNRQKKRSTGRSGALGVTFLVTIGVVVAVGFAIPACVSMRLCTSGGDTDLAYVFYLLCSAPIYWFFAKTFAAKK